MRPKLGVFPSCVIEIKRKAKMSLFRCARMFYVPDARFPAFERERLTSMASWKGTLRRAGDESVSGSAEMGARLTKQFANS